MSRKLTFVLIFALCSAMARAEDPPPPPQAPHAAAPQPVALGRKGTFYLALMSPIPAGFGGGITHYFSEFVGFTLELG